MKKKLQILLAIITICHCQYPCKSFALTLSEAIDTALKNNPSLQMQSKQVLVQKEALAQQKKKKSPTVSANASYVRSGSEGVTATHQTGSYGTGFTLEQLIADSGKTEANIRSAQFTLLSSEYDFKAAQNDLIVETVFAYWTTLVNRECVTIAERKHQNYENRLKWAESFYRVGTKAKIEVTRAKSELATSKSELVKNQAEFEESKQKLAQLLSLEVSDIKELDSSLAYQDTKFDTTNAIENALKNRPELLATKALLSASNENLALQKKGYSPSFTAGVGYNFGNNSYFDSDQWNARLSASIPLFDGGVTNSKIREAQAKKEIAAAKLKDIENSVRYEVSVAITTMNKSNEAYFSMLEAEKAAEETLRLANGRYKAGTGDSLEISDAIEKLANAQYNTLKALYTFRAAQIEYLRAIGERYNAN
ncbi:MAG: TolC family protein [Synergistaceae bacterium]|nr:TolC family protein [Synergistaceae bacterium]